MEKKQAKVFDNFCGEIGRIKANNQKFQQSGKIHEIIDKIIEVIKRSYSQLIERIKFYQKG